ncbi:MAG: transcriptional repressor [Tissierellia bacterium]|nr:transcriptional repressor [Tissierellia bacterium]
MDQLYDEYCRILKAAGYKHTKPRLSILEVMLENHNKHLSIEEILKLAQEKDPEIGIATAYRTLLLFEQLNMVYKLDFGDGLSRYEINEGNVGHHHHHLICLGCDKIIEAKWDLLDELEEAIQEDEHFSIVDHSLKFYGYCSECQAKDRKGEKHEERK